MANFSDFVPEVLSAAPDCPNPTIIRSVRTAVRELCEQADCYRYTLEDSAVRIGVSEIELDLPSDTSLHRVIKLSIGRQDLGASSVTLMNDLDPQWRTRNGAPRFYLRSTEDLNSIVINPIPEVEYTGPGLLGEVALKPTLTATSISDVFVDRYYQVIVDGAIKNLLMISSAPWFNPGIAGAHQAAFAAGILSAKSQAQGDNTPKRRVVAYGGL